jgi:hypothetical protein
MDTIKGHCYLAYVASGIRVSFDLDAFLEPKLSPVAWAPSIALVACRCKELSGSTFTLALAGMLSNSY